MPSAFARLTVSIAILLAVAVAASVGFDSVDPRVQPAALLAIRDLPLERDDRYYSILLLGGTAAEELASQRDTVFSIESILNRSYVSPTGRPFRVLNGAAAGSKAPQSLGALNLYGNRADAAFSLDGLEEARDLDSPYSLAMPSVEGYLYGQRSLRDLPLLLDEKLLAQVSRPALRHLAVFRLLASTLERRVDREIADDGPGGKNHDRIYKYFALPPDWTVEARRDWNIKKYEKAIRLMKASAEAQGIAYAHFVEPLSAIQKPPIVEAYRSIVATSEKLRGQGIPTFDLGDCPDYRLLAERIARELAHAWRWKAKGAESD